MHTIKSVRLDRAVEIQAYRQEGSHSRPVSNTTPVIIDADVVRALIDELEARGILSEIVDDLQSLVERDGIKLLTACISFESFLEFSDLLPAEADFVSWGENGCNQAVIHFEKDV